MVRRATMSTIRIPSDSGSAGDEATAFIQCINGPVPQIHELWCLGLERIICEVHATLRVEVTVETVGEFVTNYLAKNGCRIYIIRQLSAYNSVQLLGLFEKPGEMDCCLFALCWLASKPQGG